MTVYYPYEKPRKDYLDFSKQALAAVGNKELVILAPDETVEGALPMVTGKTYKEVKSPSDIRDEGIYIWEDNKHDWVLNGLNRQHARMEMLFQITTDHTRHRTIRIAHIFPSQAPQKVGAKGP